MSKYCYKKQNDSYVIFVGNKVLLTPVEHNVVCTPHEKLAKRLVEDINKFGLDYTNGNSLFSWQCTYLDRAVPYGYQIFRRAMENSFLNYPDWTFDSTYLNDEKLASFFGSWKPQTDEFGKVDKLDAVLMSVYASSPWEYRIQEMKSWLDNLSLMQLTAACCIANAYESLNVSYSLATIIHEKVGEERDNAINEFGSLVDNCGFFPQLNVFGQLLQDKGIFDNWSSPTVWDFKNFELYYSFDLKNVE